MLSGYYPGYRGYQPGYYNPYAYSNYRYLGYNPYHYNLLSAPVRAPVAAPAPAPALPAGVTQGTQYHFQDQLGNINYGYSNINSAKHEVHRCNVHVQNKTNIKIAGWKYPHWSAGPVLLC